MKNIKYFFVGVVFGITFLKAEIISWFRIQEMFRFQSFHMYGVMGTAVVTGVISIAIIQKLNLRSMEGEKVSIPPKKFHQGLVYGGFIFGLGWALTGACPGPLFGQIGAGFTVTIVTLASAIGGTWIYGWIRETLPH
jgi:uncharacterized membrane protein YedE/YeeE